MKHKDFIKGVCDKLQEALVKAEEVKKSIEAECTLMEAARKDAEELLRQEAIAKSEMEEKMRTESDAMKKLEQEVMMKGGASMELEEQRTAEKRQLGEKFLEAASAAAANEAKLVDSR